MSNPDADVQPTERDLSAWPGLTEHERSIILRLPRVAFHVWVYLAQRVGQGVCRKCLNEAMQAAGTGSDQLAAHVRCLRTEGFAIPKYEPRLRCPVHGLATQDRLTAVAPDETASRTRWHYSPAELARIRGVLGGRDAFDGDRAARLEVDHRIPMLRAEQDEQRVDPDDEQAVRATFQMLSGTHNLLKSRACESCVATGNRPAFLGMPSAVDASTRFEPAGCGVCAWAYPERWKAHVALLLAQS